MERIAATVVLAALVLGGCRRPSSDYEVGVWGEGTWLDEVAAPGEPMVGSIEVARYRLRGEHLGYGITGFFGDPSFVDGVDFTLGWAEFGYPADPAYDRVSALVSPGPATAPAEDACTTRVDPVRAPGTVEMVDVGHRIRLQAEGASFTLDRDPAVYPDPAGEQWFVGYGGVLGPAVLDHPQLPSSWAPGAAATVSFPGTVQPAEATVGAIPYPATASVDLPAAVEDLAVDATPVEAGSRHPGPWRGAAITWAAGAGGPVTITVRYLGAEGEGSCDLGCAEGLSCVEGQCVPDEGSGWRVLGEVACTVADDGAFELGPAHVERLDAFVDPRSPEVAGAVLLVSRITEARMPVADVLTWNDRRVPGRAARVRLIDTVATRLELP